jgi:hypothetical protein
MDTELDTQTKVADIPDGGLCFDADPRAEARKMVEQRRQSDSTFAKLRKDAFPGQSSAFLATLMLSSGTPAKLSIARHPLTLADKECVRVVSILRMYFAEYLPTFDALVARHGVGGTVTFDLAANVEEIASLKHAAHFGIHVGLDTDTDKDTPGRLYDYFSFVFLGDCSRQFEAAAMCRGRALVIAKSNAATVEEYVQFIQLVLTTQVFRDRSEDTQEDDDSDSGIWF